jgi:hypothetical protein
MATTSTQEIKQDNCTHEPFFKAFTRMTRDFATSFVKDKNQVPHPIRHISDMSEHYVHSESDNIQTTCIGTYKFSECLEKIKIIGRRKGSMQEIFFRNIDQILQVTSDYDWYSC